MMRPYILKTVFDSFATPSFQQLVAVGDHYLRGKKCRLAEARW